MTSARTSRLGLTLLPHEDRIVAKGAELRGLSKAAFARMAIMEQCRAMGLEFEYDILTVTCPDCGQVDELADNGWTGWACRGCRRLIKRSEVK